jgi:hypothetical protein
VGLWARSPGLPVGQWARSPGLSVGQWARSPGLSVGQWAHLGSNQERPGYEPGALTN